MDGVARFLPAAEPSLKRSRNNSLSTFSAAELSLSRQSSQLPVPTLSTDCVAAGGLPDIAASDFPLRAAASRRAGHLGSSPFLLVVSDECHRIAQVLSGVALYYTPSAWWFGPAGF